MKKIIVEREVKPIDFVAARIRSPMLTRIEREADEWIPVVVETFALLALVVGAFLLLGIGS